MIQRIPALAAISCILTLVTAPRVLAQDPLLRLQPTTTPGQSLQGLLVGLPHQQYATLIDLEGGPTPVLGERFWLSLTPALTQIDVGRLDAIGARSFTLPTPNLPGIAGIPLFMQSLVLDASAPNGMFRTSNGQSAILHGSSASIVFEFRNAGAEGITGTYDSSVTERLMAGAPTRRTHTVAPSSGLPFNLPIATPLAVTNARMQHVFRAADLGATGERELVAAMRWRPFGPVVADSFPRVQITLGNSTIVPDYTIDPWSALPQYPLSGLGMTFANNFKPLQPPVVVCDQSYSITPSALRPDGFMPWPSFTAPFFYNGIDSLLVDFRVLAGPNTLGANGFAVRLMVLSSPTPNTRVFAPGNLQPPIDPFTISNAAQGDNTLYEMQFEFARPTSFAITPFVRNPGPALRPSPALVAASVPPGTSYQLTFEGASDANGTNSTGFTYFVQHLVGQPWLRMRVHFDANPFTGARPSIDTVVIPVD